MYKHTNYLSETNIIKMGVYINFLMSTIPQFLKYFVAVNNIV